MGLLLHLHKLLSVRYKYNSGLHVEMVFEMGSRIHSNLDVFNDKTAYTSISEPR